MCVEGRGRISRSVLIQGIKMGSCVFQCDVPHQWIAQRQVGPVSVYCDGVGCRVLCLRHGISAWQHIGLSITATSRHRRDITPTNKQRTNTKLFAFNFLRSPNCWHIFILWQLSYKHSPSQNNIGAFTPDAPWTVWRRQTQRAVLRTWKPIVPSPWNVRCCDF